MDSKKAFTGLCAFAAPILLPLAAEASSASSPSLTGYLIRVGAGLALLGLAGYWVVKYSRGAAPGKARGAVEILTSLPLGKDVLFIVRLGPDVVALASGSSGTRVIGRWPYEEWKRNEAEAPPE